MAIVKEYAREPLQIPSQLVELVRCLRTHENLTALSHGIPDVAAVLGHASRPRSKPGNSL